MITGHELEDWLRYALIKMFKSTYSATAVELHSLKRRYWLRAMAKEVGLRPGDDLLKFPELPVRDTPSYMWGLGWVLNDRLISKLAECGFSDQLIYHIEVVQVGNWSMKWPGIDLKKSKIEVFFSARSSLNMNSVVSKELLEAFENDRVLNSMRLGHN